MNKRPINPVLLTALAVALPVLLSACSDSDSTTTATPTTDTTDTTPDQTPTLPTEIPGALTRSSIGDVFVFGAAKRTLYTFANDSTGQSNCNNDCATVWPPIAAATAQTSGGFSTITRDDNSLQWAYKGRPLYYYQGDATEGEINGEGLGGSWYVARPNPFTRADTGNGYRLTGQGTINSDGTDPSTRSEYDGYTLYTFQNDSVGTSACNGGCATTWPPLYADKGAIASDGYELITRDDGTMQWTYNEQPLYFYQGDTAPGDTNGDGIGGVWYIAAANP